MPAYVSEVVQQPAHVEVIQAGAGNGFAVVLQASRLHVEARFLFVGRIARRCANTNLGDPRRAAPALVGFVGRTRWKRDNPHGLPVAPVKRLPEWNRRRAQVRARRLHHPLLGLLARSGQARDAPVLLDSQQDVTTLQIEQRGHAPCQPLRCSIVALELDSEVLAMVNQLGQFGSIHVALSRTRTYPLRTRTPGGAIRRRPFFNTHHRLVSFGPAYTT